MTDAKKPERIKLVEPPADAEDLSSLWLDPSLGDGITDTHFHEIPVGRPRDFFRVHPDKTFRRQVEIYTHKSENTIEEEHYIVDAAMRGRIDEAQPCTLAVVIYRDGSPRFWPLKFPRDGEKDNDAWTSARKSAGTAIGKWVKLLWKRRAYITRDAMPGYAPDPDWSKLPSYDAMIRIAFGQHGIIRDETHPIYRELFGMKPETPKEGEGDDL